VIFQHVIRGMALAIFATCFPILLSADRVAGAGSCMNFSEMLTAQPFNQCLLNTTPRRVQAQPHNQVEEEGRGGEN